MLGKISIPFTQLTPILSLILSIVAILFSIWQYFDRKSYEGSLRKSKIIVRIGIVKDQNLVFNEFFNEIIVRQRYRCVLSNLGFVNEGIVDCKIYSLEKHELNGENKIQYAVYAGMNPEFIDINNEKITFPLNILARESKIIYIDIGMIIPKLVWKSVAETDKIMLDQPIDWKNADTIFNDFGYPCFGQLSYIESENFENFSVIKHGEGLYYQTFWLQFFKTDNSQVTAEFSLMTNDMHIQGEV